MPPRRRSTQDNAKPATPSKGIIRHDDAFPLAELKPYYKNPRRGNLELIRESLRANGQYRSVFANVGTFTGRPNEVLGGNHTVAGMKAEGFETAAVDWVDVDEETAKRMVLADNRISDVAKNDDEVLKELVVSLEDLAGSGFTDEDLAKMLDEGDDPDTDPQLPDASYAIIVDCADEEDQARLLVAFEDEGLSARPLMM